MSARHTPGPWLVSKPGSDFEVGDASDRLIAIVTGDNWGQWRDADDNGEAEFEANARLIAAAPDLLVVANQALAAFSYLSIAAKSESDRAEFKSRETVARSAIAKAEGRL